MNYIAKITNDEGETIAKISALSIEGLEEQLHKLESQVKKLKAFDLKFVPDEPYEEQRDERTEDYPLGNMLEPYDIAGDR